MSDIENPYQSPQTETQSVEPLVSDGILTETMLKYLNEASPWLRFLGIMGFIGSGLMAVGGISSLALMPLAANLNEAYNPFGNVFGELFSSLGSLMVLYSLYFLGGGALMFFPAFFTYRFGAKIRTYFQTNAIQDLELAFRNNKSLWKFNGILTIVSLAIVPAATIIMTVVLVAALSVR